MNCEVCGSDRFVDAHHYDCKEGEIDSETIKLCRRCHRTYHDRGIEWFDDKYLDKAIEIENKRREKIYACLKNPTKQLVVLRREEVKRSNYWNKIHGIKSAKQQPRETKDERQLGFQVVDNLMAQG